MSKHLLFIIVIVASSASFSQKISLFFEFDSFQLSTSELEKINLLKKEKVDFVRIESFCDSSGSIIYNRRLAEKRAKHVLEYLKVDAIETRLIGEEYTLDAKISYNAAQWRKVDIYYYPATTSSGVYEYDNENQEIDESLAIKSIFDNTDNLEKAIEEGEPIVLSILFIPGSNQLFNETSYHELWRLFHFMNNNPSMHAFIRGHVCCGSAGSLSYERAYTVYQFLTQRGISPKRLKYQGFDNTLPVSTSEDTEEERQMNRRVDVVFTKIIKEN